MKVALFQLTDGRLAVCKPAEGSELPGETEEDWFKRSMERTLSVYSRDPKFSTAIRLKDCDFSELPNRRFRDCWRDSGDGKAKVDMPLARFQRTSEIREERDKRFQPLDNEWMKFIGQGNSVEAGKIEAKRVILRDIPNDLDLDSISTPEELESFNPKWPK